MNDCIKILIVDDMVMNRKIFSQMLKNEGYELYFADNGKAGVDKVGEVQPDLVIMDIEMPVMKGNEAVQILRKQGYKGVIIACSGTIKTDNGMYSGCNHALHKPVRGKEFRKTIREYLSVKGLMFDRGG